MNKDCYAAIDLGASSGRIVVGYIKDEKLILEEIYRFDNIQKRSNGHDCWDLPMLENNIIKGLAQCPKKGFQPKTIGIDTWGVDFVAVDKNGSIIGDAVAYRDNRTDGIMDEKEPMTFDEIYSRIGIQKLPFNTLYQFVALRRETPEVYEKAYKFLMIPEYLMFKLTGKMVAEYTNCSTTSMINAKTYDWDDEIFEAYNLDKEKFLKPEMPGKIIGPVTKEVAKKIGYQTDMALVATHDTGSAYISIPSTDKHSANLSSGTWSLLGCVLKEAVTNKFAKDANFTNEGGYSKNFRFLKNIMGLWIIQCVRRELNCVDYVENQMGSAQENSIERFTKLKYMLKDVKMQDYSFQDLIDEAKKAMFFVTCFDVNDDRFLAPKSMIGEIQSACKEANLPYPKTVGQLMTCIYNSLAACYLKEMDTLSFLIEHPITSLNIVGGGCQDDYLNQITANVTGVDVYAGPVEGTSIGNIAIQLFIDKVIQKPEELKALLNKSFKIKKYEPFQYIDPKTFKIF